MMKGLVSACACMQIDGQCVREYRWGESAKLDNIIAKIWQRISGEIFCFVPPPSGQLRAQACTVASNYTGIKYTSIISFKILAIVTIT
jgi:hypothetical protein